MNGDWTILFIVAFFLPLLCGYYFWQRWMREVRRRKLEVMAAVLRLELTERNLSDMQARFSGHSGGIPAHLMVGPLGGVDIRMTVDAPLPAGLCLGRDSGSGQDIELGIPALDAFLHVQGAHPEGIIRFLHEPELRTSLHQLFSRHPEASVAGHEVRLSLSAFEGDEVLARAVRQAAKVAQALVESSRALVAASAQAPDWMEAPAPPSSEWVRETFARRTRIYYLGLGLSSLGMFAVAVAATIVSPWSRSFKYHWVCAWFAVLAFVWWFALRVVRCPACSADSRSLAEKDRHVPLSSPLACGGCGVRLR